MNVPRKPASRIDEHGRRQVAPTWKSLVERQLREAMDDGRFDDLPYQGQRIPLEDDALAGDRAMAFHVLRNANVAPPWIEADKEVRDLLARRDAIVDRAAARPTPSALAERRDRTELEALVVEANGAIARLNAEAPTARQHRRPLSLVDELARLAAARHDGPHDGPNRARHDGPNGARHDGRLRDAGGPGAASRRG